ncbi:ankyrin repeat-containing domain protein [Lentinula raphanica]|nr:ankyrin repeat-containing domain protein [Lentinula raphanica]
MTPDLSSDEEKELRDWLAAPDSSITYATTLNKKVSGTGQWILEDLIYSRWKKEGSILCIQGQAGSGKTFLVTNIIQSFKQATFPTFIIYHYFDTRDNSGLKSSLQGLLSSFLLQLGAQDQKIHPALQQLHNSSKHGLVHSRPSNSELQDTLMKILKDLHEKKYKVYIIIDALDECKEEEEVWNFCVTITSLELVSGIMLSTRNYRPEYSKYSTISLRNNINVDNDIDIFLKEKISFESMVLNTEIQTTLMEKADGGFRYIDCQLQILKSSANARRIHKALNKLPSNLEETYSEAIKRCENSDYSDEAENILSWILYAFEPLYMRQIATILSIDLEAKEVELDEKMLVGLEEIIDTTLVTVDNRDIVQLAHASVKDFLLDSHNNSQTSRLLNINAKLAHNIISQMCLICLLSQREYKPIWGDLKWVTSQDIVTFEQYATEYWAKHCQYNEREEFPYEDTIQLTQEFLHNELGVLENWKQNFQDLEFYIWNEFPFWQRSNLYIAAFFGLKTYMQRVLINDLKLDSDRFKRYQMKLTSKDINTQGGFHGVIQAAAVKGHKDIVELILRHGADINFHGDIYGTAITAAVLGGHQDVVEYLVQHGANINLKVVIYGTALAAAALKGHQNVVEYLVQCGANINLQGDNTAIGAAAYGGHQGIIEYLLQHGADINLQGGYFGTAIAAALWGQSDVVGYLLQNGADINLQGSDVGTAIAAAASAGHQNIVEYLVQCGADINLQGGNYGTAIATAAFWGHQDMVKYLVQNGADINLQGGYYGTAITAAALRGHQDVVEYLVQHGADINLQGGDYGTAVAAAASQGDQNIVEYLVQHGADINLHGGKYRTAIEAAAFRGHQDIVEYLQQHGAVLNLQGDD